MVIQGVTYLSDFEAKKAIMEMARRLEAKGWLVAGDGSMSVRVGPQAVWVTVAGADKARHAGYAGARGYEWQGDAQRKAQAPARRPAHPSENLSGKRERPVRDAHLSGLRGCDGDAGPDRAACSVQPRSAGAGTGGSCCPPRTWTHRHRLSACCAAPIRLSCWKMTAA